MRLSLYACQKCLLFWKYVNHYFSALFHLIKVRNAYISCSILPKITQNFRCSLPGVHLFQVLPCGRFLSLHQKYGLYWAKERKEANRTFTLKFIGLIKREPLPKKKRKKRNFNDFVIHILEKNISFFWRKSGEF